MTLSTVNTETQSLLRTSDYFNELQTVVRRLPHSAIDQVAEVLFYAHQQERTVFIFGNGGSAALASHFACDLAKGVANMGKQRGFRAIPLTDNVPIMTAWANDSSYEDIFSEQLRNWVEPGDVAFAISGSGNSKNILKALRVAREMSATCLGISGFEGGEMKALCDFCAIVPSTNMQIIEDLHLSIAHALFTTLRQQIQSCTNPHKVTTNLSY